MLGATEEDGVGVSRGVCFGVGEQDPNRGLSAFDAALVKHLVGPSGSPVEALGRSERGWRHRWGTAAVDGNDWSIEWCQ